MMFPGPRQITRSLSAVMSLARGDAQALARLDLTSEGFWRAFWVALLVAPFAVLFIFVERRMWPAMHHAAALPPALLHYLVELLAFAAYWGALPIAMIFITRALKRTQRFVPAVVAWSWANFVCALLLTPAIVLYLIGTVSPQGLVVLTAVGLILSVAFQARVTEAALDTGALLSLGVSILNVAFAVALASAAGKVLQIFAPHAG